MQGCLGRTGQLFICETFLLTSQTFEGIIEKKERTDRMIREFSVKLKPSNSKARYIFIGCMVSAFALVSASNLISKYRGLVCLAGVLALVAALTVYTKYMVVDYYYDLMIDSAGIPLFVARSRVKSANGGRETTLCRIELADIRKIEAESREERKAHKTPQGYLKYSYLPTISPDKSYRLTVISRYERSEILIEINDEFAQLLSNYVKEAKELCDREELE